MICGTSTAASKPSTAAARRACASAMLARTSARKRASRASAAMTSACAPSSRDAIAIDQRQWHAELNGDLPLTPGAGKRRHAGKRTARDIVARALDVEAERDLRTSG